MKNIRLLVAFIQSIFPFLVSVLFALIAYIKIVNPFNIILSIIVLFIGFLNSRNVFNMARRRGIIETMTGDNASYELDNLDPNSYNKISKYSASEFSSKFKKGSISLSQVSIRIWGDWDGRNLDKKHEFYKVDFDDERNILTIEFKDYCLLQIREPGMILYSDTYLKIINAKEINWQTERDKKDNKKSFSYLNNGHKITTKSNTNWIPHRNDFGKGMDALYLQGLSMN